MKFLELGTPFFRSQHFCLASVVNFAIFFGEECTSNIICCYISRSALPNSTILRNQQFRCNKAASMSLLNRNLHTHTGTYNIQASLPKSVSVRPFIVPSNYVVALASSHYIYTNIYVYVCLYVLLLL